MWSLKSLIWWRLSIMHCRMHVFLLSLGHWCVHWDLASCSGVFTRYCRFDRFDINIDVWSLKSLIWWRLSIMHCRMHVFLLSLGHWCVHWDLASCSGVFTRYCRFDRFDINIDVWSLVGGGGVGGVGMSERRSKRGRTGYVW